MAALRPALLAAAAGSVAAGVLVPTPSLRGANLTGDGEKRPWVLGVGNLGAGAELRGGAGLDVDGDQTCFTGNSHESFYRNPLNDGTDLQGRGMRGDWAKCLPEPSFAIMCQHLKELRDGANPQGQADINHFGPNQGLLHDKLAGALYEQLFRVYNSSGYLVELRMTPAMKEAVNQYVLGQGPFASNLTDVPDETWEWNQIAWKPQGALDLVKSRLQHVNDMCFSANPKTGRTGSTGMDNRRSFRDSMFCGIVRNAWLTSSSRRPRDVGTKTNCAQTCELLQGCSELRPRKCHQRSKELRELKCFCRDGSSSTVPSTRDSCDEVCGAERGCGNSYQVVAEACEDYWGRCFCKGDRFKVVLDLDFGGDTVKSTGAEAMRLSPNREEKKFFEKNGMANDVGGWEVCDGTDHAELEDNSSCSDGTRALGASGPCLVKLEGMSFADAEPMCARKGGRLAKFGVHRNYHRLAAVAGRETAAEGLGLGYKFNTTYPEEYYEELVREQNWQKLAGNGFWRVGVAGEIEKMGWRRLTGEYDEEGRWETMTTPNDIERLMKRVKEVLFGSVPVGHGYQQGKVSNEACLVFGKGNQLSSRGSQVVNCQANIDWLCEGISTNTKNHSIVVKGDLKADEGAFCLWHLPKDRLDHLLPNGQAGGFDNAKLANNAPLPFPGSLVGWEGAKANMTFLPASATRDATAFHCHWSPTNTGLMRMYELQHMYERGYPGAMKDRCACGYRHMKALLKRCDCTRSGKQNQGCQKFHEQQLKRATDKKVKCNRGQCGESGKL